MAVAGIYIICRIDDNINSLPTNKNIPEIVEYIFTIPYSLLMSIMSNYTTPIRRTVDDMA